MESFKGMSDKVILAEIGQRVRRYRLSENITQEELSRKAGVARIVVHHLENGNGSNLKGFIRILRVLGFLEQLNLLMPAPEPSPIELADMKGHPRERASGTRLGKKDKRLPSQSGTRSYLGPIGWGSGLE